jgi:hypothetical protein
MRFNKLTTTMCENVCCNVGECHYSIDLDQGCRSDENVSNILFGSPNVRCEYSLPSVDTLRAFCNVLGVQVSNDRLVSEGFSRDLLRQGHTIQHDAK